MKNLHGKNYAIEQNLHRANSRLTRQTNELAFGKPVALEGGVTHRTASRTQARRGQQVDRERAMAFVAGLDMDRRRVQAEQPKPVVDHAAILARLVGLVNSLNRGTEYWPDGLAEHLDAVVDIAVAMGVELIIHDEQELDYGTTTRSPA